MKIFVISSVLVAAAASVASAIVVDGTAEAAYGPAKTTQNISTSFGNSTTGAIDTAGGSELDQTFATVSGGVLYVHLAGNLESNFNKMDLFIDSVAGGQNKITNAAGSFGSTTGLQFDAGFNADYALCAGGGNSPYTLYVNNAQFNTDGTSSEGYIGQGGAGGTGTLAGGTNPNGILAAINNTNVAGVTGGTAADSGAGVTTGLEFAIPLSAIGNPTGTILLSAFVNGSNNDYLANQVSGGLPAGTGSLAAPSGVNFASIAGNQYFSVTVPEPTTLAALGGIGSLLIRRRK